MGNKWEEREGRKESVVTEKWRRGENEWEGERVLSASNHRAHNSLFLMFTWVTLYHLSLIENHQWSINLIDLVSTNRSYPLF
jgi:hypothetical protein